MAALAGIAQGARPWFGIAALQSFSAKKAPSTTKRPC